MILLAPAGLADRVARRKGCQVPGNTPIESDGPGRVLAGKCECGAVRYRVADAFLYATNCHCSSCRAATGSAFKPFAGIEREKLESRRAWTSSWSSERTT